MILKIGYGTGKDKNFGFGSGIGYPLGPGHLEYPISEILDDSENKSGMDLVWTKISAEYTVDQRAPVGGNNSNNSCSPEWERLRERGTEINSCDKPQSWKSVILWIPEYTNN